MSYDTRWNKPTKIKDQSGQNYVEYEYDDWGRTKKITPSKPENCTSDISTNITYEWAVNPAINSIYRITSSTGGQTSVTQYFDALDRLVREETTENGCTKFTQNTYDNRGNIIETKTNDANCGTITITSTYDEYNRLKTMYNDATAVNTNITYTSGSGNFIRTITQTGQPTKQIQTDATGNIRKITENGVENTYHYKAHGGLYKVNQGGKEVFYATYDNTYGRQTKITDPNAGIIQYTYNDFGNLIKQTDARNNITQNEYDDLGRLSETKLISGDDPADIISTGYEYYPPGTNGGGQIKKIISNLVTDEFAYDENNRMTQTKRTLEGKEFIIGITYGDYGRVEEFVNPSVSNTPLKLAYQYFDNGLINRISVVNGSSTKRVFSISQTQYNAYNQPKKYYTAINNAETGTAVVSENKYTITGLPTQYLTQIGAEPIQNLEMTWDNTNGNLLSRTDNVLIPANNSLSRKEEFGYDNFNRLTQRKYTTNGSSSGSLQEIATYENSGNITAKLGIGVYAHNTAGTYTYDETKIHAVTKVVLDSLANAQDKQPQTIEYNVYNQPSKITQGNKEMLFYYDYNGQRIKTTYKENNTIKYSRYYFGDYEFTTNGGVITTAANIKNQVNYIHTPRRRCWYVAWVIVLAYQHQYCKTKKV